MTLTLAHRDLSRRKGVADAPVVYVAGALNDVIGTQTALRCSISMSRRHQQEVLIVEDEPITRMVAADVITDLGLPALEASDADEALEILNANPEVAVLFTDIDMPGSMNGVQLAQKVHEHWPDIELIVTSGASNIADADLPDHGTFIRKPYRLQQLAEIVEKKLGATGG